MKAKDLANLLLQQPDADVVVDQIEFYSGGHQNKNHCISDEIEFLEKENKFVISGYYDTHWAS